MLLSSVVIRGRGENNPSSAKLKGRDAGLSLIGFDTRLSLLMFHDRQTFRVLTSARLLPHDRNLKVGL